MRLAKEEGGEGWRMHIFISGESWQLGAQPFCPVCVGVLYTEGLDDWTQTKGRREGSFARRPVCSSILIISVVTIYFLCTHPYTAVRTARQTQAACVGTWAVWTLRWRRHSVAREKGCLKTQQEGMGGGGAASLPNLWVRLQPVRLHNSCLALGQNHNSGHMSDVKISYPGGHGDAKGQRRKPERLWVNEGERETAGRCKGLQDGRHGNLTEIMFWEDKKCSVVKWKTFNIS